MNLIEKISPEWALRLSLALMYLYSGQDLFFNPRGWHWALPYWLRQLIEKFIPLNTYISLQGLVEILLALVFIAWFIKPKFVKWAALISTLELVAILLLAFIPWNSANFLITFRDIGLVGASLALLALLIRREKMSL